VIRLRSCEYPTAVRRIDLGDPLDGLTDVCAYRSVQLYVTLGSRLLGTVTIANRYAPVSAARLRDAIAEGLARELYRPPDASGPMAPWTALTGELAQRLTPQKGEDAGLPSGIPVSVIVATHDRPDDLRSCLRCLTAQLCRRPVQIIVVDNHPDSGLTQPVLDEFPGVLRVNEARQGVAFARNAALAEATGQIIVTTDDDVTMPRDWLEKLVAPFARKDIAAVTGNILPLELETRAQCLFEAYGGLGRGFRRREVDPHWFRSYHRRPVPTWQLGGTANAAFRADIFSHPEIGLMDEALGPGMPSGVGEDTYLFYRIIKAGYTLLYEPDAYVWHRHRRDMSSLRGQIYNYSKGHIAYHLTTLIKDRDWRALVRVLIPVSRSHLWRIKRRLRGRSAYPVSLVLLEWWGNLVGPFALWRSWRRVRREGRSTNHIAAAGRGAIDAPGALDEASGTFGGPCGLDRGP
jgi:glycosyltransferase involved in cell wall biosynthesis